MSFPDRKDEVARGGRRSAMKATRARTRSEEGNPSSPLIPNSPGRRSSLSSRTTPQGYFTSLEDIDLALFLNLMILEAEHNLLSDPQKATLEQIKKDREFREVFLSASSCRRHVYIFRRSDMLEQPVIPELRGLAESTSKAGSLRIYLGMDSLKFLMVWLSGSLNEGKYCNDTYNRKTVNTCVELFENFLQMRKDSDGDFKAFGKEFTKLQNQLDAEIRDLKTKKPPNFEEKIKWLETKKEEASRMKDFNFLRIDEHSKPDNFLLDLRNAFVVANKLCNVFERIKYLPQIKDLWSGAIKKETLDIIKAEDRELFSGIMKCRKDFIEYTSDILLEALKERTMSMDDINSRITERFAVSIKELSSAARKYMPVEELSADSQSPLAEATAGAAVPPPIPEVAADQFDDLLRVVSEVFKDEENPDALNDGEAVAAGIPELSPAESQGVKDVVPEDFKFALARAESFDQELADLLANRSDISSTTNTVNAVDATKVVPTTLIPSKK